MDSELQADLQAENQALRRQLESLLREARNNEEKIRRFDQLEHRLIGARSMAELLSLLLNDYRQAFGIDAVSMVLLDRDDEASRMLDAERHRHEGPASAQGQEPALLDGLTLLPTIAPIAPLFQGQLNKPWLGPSTSCATGRCSAPPYRPQPDSGLGRPAAPGPPWRADRQPAFRQQRPGPLRERRRHPAAGAPVRHRLGLPGQRAQPGGGSSWPA